MSSLEIIKRKINKLEERADAIEYRVTDLIESLTIHTEARGRIPYRFLCNRVQPEDVKARPDLAFRLFCYVPLHKIRYGIRGSYDEYYEIYHWASLTPEQGETRRKAIREYEGWYSAAYQLIKDYLPERTDDFSQYYEYQKGKSTKDGVIDYLQFRRNPGTNCNSDIIESLLSAFERQRSILLSVLDVAEIKELNLRKLISADVVKTEIEQAGALLVSGYIRAAGVVAGVALERYLKTLCDINGIAYGSRDTIQPIAQLLRTAGKLDIVEMNRITYLASIRNKCSHPDSASDEEVKSLIDEVKKLI